MVCCRGVTRRLFSPRTGYSAISRNLWRNDPEGPALDPSENTIDDVDRSFPIGRWTS
jgi:hypothetical protein